MDPTIAPPTTATTTALLEEVKENLQSLHKHPMQITFNLNGPKGLITDAEEPPSFDSLEQEWR